MERGNFAMNLFVPEALQYGVIVLYRYGRSYHVMQRCSPRGKAKERRECLGFLVTHGGRPDYDTTVFLDSNGTDIRRFLLAICNFGTYM